MSLSKRVMVRLSDADEAWVAEQAEDEGVDNATFLRMLVTRLRRGRPPLMRLAIDGAAAVPHSPASDELYYAQASAAPTADAQQITDLLEQRAREAAANDGPDGVRHNDEPHDGGAMNGAEPVAVPLRRVPRQQYNPGHH